MWSAIKFILSIGVAYCRQAFDPNASGLESLQWDSASLYQIDVKSQMSYDDAFTIEEVAIAACNDIVM